MNLAKVALLLRELLHPARRLHPPRPEGPDPPSAPAAAAAAAEASAGGGRRSTEL